MPSSSREGSRDRELSLKHQQSFSESVSSRASVPMWDSSDPERAPPPLPLNPSTSSPITRSNTSATVAAAAAALTEKSRESAGPSPYTTNPMPNKRDSSPEKSLIKGHHHKRMQSLQAGGNNVRDLSLYLDGANNRSPERSPDRFSMRSSTSSPTRDLGDRSPERSPNRNNTPTPFSKDTSREIPAARPTRPPPRSILGENTPPTSATMLALQNMATPTKLDSPLGNITNSATPTSKTPQTFDGISTQILSLTSIATSLQREMAQLSRRSKDNATDLISLKEATNARDEDIRKSLRDLVSNLNGSQESSKSQTSRSQSAPGTGAFLLDNKPHCSPPSKTFALPRIPSPNSFAASLERELAGSPSPYNMDGAANLALLEKILREMGTKEGQERVMTSLTDMIAEMKGQNNRTAEKLEEVLSFVKEKSSALAVVNRGKSASNDSDGPPQLELNFDTPRTGPMARTTRDLTPHPSPSVPRPGVGGEGRTAFASPRAADFVGEDILKLLRKMKDSVTENGGLTSEIKALVRELRGEVLGMGRELARKLEAADRNVDSRSGKPNGDELARIVQDGLGELRDHMDLIVREKRRQSSSSTISRSTVDSQEVYQAVRHAMGEMQVQQKLAPQSGIEKEEILEAIREAWESYKPEIELQNFGLEREEILQCLREGLEAYQPQSNSRDVGGIGREEVLDAVREGLHSFTPPAPLETEATITRDEILLTVRECLEAFPFPSQSRSGPTGAEIDREDVLEAVREGLGTFDFPKYAPGVGTTMSRDEMVIAVKEGIEARGVSTDGPLSTELLERIHELLDTMRVEFKDVSDEAKQKFATNGGDTERVLDTVKDGLECLRTDIEAYVDRAADVTGRDEILDAIRASSEQLRESVENARGESPGGETFHFIKDEFEHLRGTLAATIVKGGASDSAEVVETMKEEFEHLRSTLVSSIVRPNASIDREEVIEAVKEGLETLRLDLEKHHHHSGRPESVLSNTSELLDAFHDGLDGLRSDVEKLINKPVDMTVSYEILDTLKDGLASLKLDLENMNKRPGSSSREITTGDGEIIAADSLKRNDIENLEILMTQLRIKVESLDGMPPPPPPSTSHTNGEGVSREDLAAVEGILRDVQSAVAELAAKERVEDENSVRKEDMDAVETLLINTKAKIDDILIPTAEGAVRKEHLDYVEAMVKDTKDIVEDMSIKLSSEGVRREDNLVLETIIKEVQVSLEEMKERAAQDYEDGERPTKTDLDAIETLCIDTKAQIEQMVMPQLETLPTKIELGLLHEAVNGHKENSTRDTIEMVRMMEDRKMDHDSLNEKVVTVQVFLEGMKEDIRLSLEDSTQGMDELGRMIDGLGETVSSNTHLATDLKEIMDIVTREFERTHGNIEGVKLDGDEKTATIMQKHDDKTAELIARLDERFEELMLKYDDAQLAADSKQKVSEERDAMNDDLLAGARTILDEVKLNTATLGTTFTEVADRLTDDSKTVFDRVDETYSRLDACHTEAKVEHQQTREAIQKTSGIVEGLQGQVREYHPKILDSVKDVLLIVGQHYEQSRKQVEETQTRNMSAPAIESAPIVPNVQQILEREKYDDTEVHAKLDKLINHANAAGKSFSQIDLLDQIHQQVLTTASEMSQFVAAQAKLITEDHESKERQAEEAAINLQQRLAHKERVESDIDGLQGEKEILATEVAALKAEKEDLSSQRLHLTADLSSLETALKIRREELAIMEARADGLERRVMEGVLDHSRALLISRSSGTSNMSLKRVSSRASTATSATATTGSHLSHSAVNMALKRGSLGAKMNPAGPNQSARRILSLNQITNNVPSGGNAFSQAPLVNIDRGLSNLKRSHSVKTGSGAGLVGGYPRKTSWAGRGKYETGDKENDLAFHEEDSEGESSDGSIGTQRRTSLGSRYNSSVGTADRKISYGTTMGTGTMIEEAEAEGEAEHEFGARRMVKYLGDADSVGGTIDGEDE